MRCLNAGAWTIVVISLAATCALGQQPATPNVRSERKAAREQWQMSGRLVPGTADLRRQAIQQKLKARALRSMFASTVTAGGSWTSLGPLPLPSDASGVGIQDYGWVSGRATAVAIDPNDSTGNTVFVGGAYGGVWKSINAGPLSFNAASVNWTPLTDDQLTLAIGAIAVQPQNSSPNASKSVVLVGTGETNSSVDSYYGLGILRSADGGGHWNLISQDASRTHSFAGIGFSQIVFSSTNPTLVVAAAASASQGIVEGLENPVTANRGLYYSNDAGVTWTAASITDAGVSVSSASVTSVAFNAAAGKFYAATRFQGFYSSPDGANWTRTSSQPGTGLNLAACPSQATQPSACPIYRGEITVVPNRVGPSGLGEMYVWYVDANDVDEGIWQSLNGGVSWTQINDSGITYCGDFFGGCGTAQGTYNLTLAAVPNGTATDLYAGASNLYKCTLTAASPTCSGTGANTFLNLTHVYGCSDIAKVHPDQHAMDFLVANGTALMYFANDGGVYRSLDGFTGLTTGTCGLSNQFDNLNATLGPMTQFVSISESPTNVNLLWGGTQDNGAPATAFSQSGGAWVNVNGGDGGFTAVNPANDNEWFIAMPPDASSGVNVLRCPNGVNCHTQDFQNDQVVSSSSVGGDTGAFYLPFILDPANSSTLLAGTCRVWRGASAGGSYSLLSPNFEFGGTGVCSGTETNLVRALAAGGPTDASGKSQVIYAGTDGNGPLIATSPQGGRVWVTTNAGGGPAIWADRTGSINPQGFPISSIAIDPADSSGQTAYVAIMGFHTSHVWKTIAAGLWWFDFSGSLPDTPADVLVIDPGSSTIYVGTDVGVFASSTASPTWDEVGQPSTQPGFLPNVAVTSLQLFNSGGAKRLRAATYGRGIWEWNLVTTPDFQISVANNPQTALAGQSATYAGTIWARNGYTSNVNLACNAGSTPPPHNCLASPASIVPTGQGATFTLIASDVPGDYSFNLQATGTDPASITHTFPLMLHVVDFSLGTPSPSAIRLAPGTSSGPISLAISAVGTFSGIVSLSCITPPAGITCQFQPSSASPTVGSPVSVTLSLTASSTAALGSSQITISASSPGAATKTQPLSLNVAAVPDYVLTVSNPNLSAQVNTTAVFNGTITALNAYSSTVALSCGAGAPANCTIVPANILPSSSGVPFTVTVSSASAQTYVFPLKAVGTDAATTAHSASLTFTALPNQSFDFGMSATPSSVAVSRGKTALFSVTVNPNTGSFPNNISASCSGLPALTSCSFNPTQVSSGSGNSVVSVSMSTTAPSSASAGLLVSLPLAGILLAPLTLARWRKLSRCLLFACLALATASCGGGLQGNGSGGGGTGNPGTKPGDYTITITATCETVTHSAAVTLTVTP